MDLTEPPRTSPSLRARLIGGLSVYLASLDDPDLATACEGALERLPAREHRAEDLLLLVRELRQGLHQVSHQGA